MLRVVFHPTSEAHNTVSTVSGINETRTANCLERGWMGTAVDGRNTIRNMLSS